MLDYYWYLKYFWSMFYLHLLRKNRMVLYLYTIDKREESSIKTIKHPWICSKKRSDVGRSRFNNDRNNNRRRYHGMGSQRRNTTRNYHAEKFCMWWWHCYRAWRAKDANNEHSLLETSIYLTIRPTRKLLEISQKCVASNFYSHSEFTTNSSRTHFSLQRVAVGKSKVEKGDTAIFQMNNSSITCVGDCIAVRPGPEECGYDVLHDPSWNMGSAYWNQKPFLYVWGVKQCFATRSDIKLDINPCAGRLGCTERYQLCVSAHVKRRS